MIKNKATIFFLSVFFATANAFAMPNLDSLEKLLPEVQGDAKLAILGDLAWYYHNIKPTKGIAFAREGLLLAEKSHNLIYLADFNSTLAANYFVLTDYNKALTHYRKAINYADSLNRPLTKASYLNNIGTIYRNEESYDSAMFYYQKAMDIYLEQNETGRVSSIYSNIASMYSDLGNVDKALDFYNKALKISLEKRDSSSLVMIYNNMALIYQNNKKFDKALSYLMKTLEMSRAIGDSNGVVTAFVNIGLNYEMTKNYQKALNTYFKILPLIKEIEDVDVLTDVYNYIGAAYYYLNKYKEAEKWIKKSLSLSSNTRKFEAMAESYDFLTKVYKASDNYKSAYFYALQHAAAKDSIANSRFNSKLAAETAKMTSKLQVALEVEKKNNEIYRLSQEQKRQELVTYYMKMIIAFIVVFLIIVFILYTMIARKNKRLRSVNENLIRKDMELRKTIAVKDKFFNVIAHDLKTPLNVFRSYLEYLIQNYDDMDDVEKREFIADLQKTSKDLDELLDDLLLWAKIQNAGLEIYSEKINLSVLASKSLEKMHSAAKKKFQTIEMDLSEEIWVKADFNTVFIAVKNILSNAVKFTPKHGKILIKTYINDAYAVLEVSDTGIGISEEQKRKLFSYQKVSTYGTENESGTGLGLLIAKELVEKNNGKIEFESKENHGSTFRILLPLFKEENERE